MPEKDENLSMGIAGATGVSSGSAHNIPVLFNIGVSGFSLVELKDLTRLNDGVVDGIECYRLMGKHPALGWQNEMWIGKKDFVIYKLRSKMEIRKAFPSDFNSISEENRKNIVFDKEISPDMFNYKPPKKVDSAISRFLRTISQVLYAGKEMLKYYLFRRIE